MVDEDQCSVVVTTGGTGPAPRDVTPEATAAVREKSFIFPLSFFLDVPSLSLTKKNNPTSKKPFSGLRPNHAGVRRADARHIAAPRPYRGPLQADCRNAREMPYLELTGRAEGDTGDSR